MIQQAELSAEQLKLAWDRVSSIPSKNSPHEPYQLAMLGAYEHGISITAQNGFAFGVSRCPAKVDAATSLPTSFPVQCEQMSKVVANADGLVTFTRTGQQMLVQSKGWKITLPSVSGDFVRPEQHDAAETHVTRVEQLVFGLDAASQALGKSHRSYSVELACLDFTQLNQPVVFAMDGANASIYRLPVIQEGTVGGTAKLPINGVRHLLHFFRHEEGVVRIKHDVNWVVVYNNDCALYCRLAEGKLPNWHKIAEMNAAPKLMQVDRQELSRAVSAVSMAADLTSPEEASVQVTCSGGDIVLQAYSSQYGSAEATVPYQGDDDLRADFVVMADRLAKAVARFTEPTIELGVTEHQNGIVFKAGQLTWLLATVAQGEDA